MPLRLSVDRAEWHRHVSEQVSSYGSGIVPVVKGSGHGFGRAQLFDWLAQHLPTALPAVGTTYEAPAGVALVLTPVLAPPERTDLLLTVGQPEHAARLDGWRGRVVVKLQSSMRRYGVAVDELDGLLATCARHGLEIAALSLHLPLAGSDADRIAEIEAWLPHLTHLPHELWVSHLEPAAFHSLAARHPSRTFRIRVGTRMWQDIPTASFIHLSADVVHTTPVAAGDPCGYRSTPAPGNGTVVCIDAGMAHGIAPLRDQPTEHSSPFHYARHRLPLLEPPHQHTSMVFVEHGQPCPAIGDRVDVQRPLTATHVDIVEWLGE
jgi:alanine racemase